jgi:ribosomal-protein-alanine N-acetyltransferase
VRIETDRLVIRSAESTDAASLLRLFNDPEVRRFIPPGEPWTIERAAQAVERRRTMERDRGHAPWIIELRETQVFIGSGGIQPVAGTDEVELAYHLLPSAWGQGFATEAVIRILDYGLSEAVLKEIIAVALPENIASCRVLEKAGMRYVGITSYHGLDGLRKYVADRSWQNPPVSGFRT